MLKKDLVRAVAAASGKTEKLVREVATALERVVLDEIAAGESVMLLGLGKLVVSHRRPKRARNMATGDPVTVPSRGVALLRPSDGLAAAANAAHKAKALT